MKHVSRVIQIFGAVAGFIPLPPAAAAVNLAFVMADALLHHAHESKLDGLKGEIMRFAARIDSDRTSLGFAGGTMFRDYLTTATTVSGV